MDSLFNKRLGTNLIALVVAAEGWQLAEPWHSPVFFTGLFAFSGALTNWLAIYMLFEKVPGLYGSGVIPEHFEEFKLGIHDMVMTQFFAPEHIERLFANDETGFDLTPVLEAVDLGPSFDSLVTTIEESNFGPMIAMIGGRSALESLRKPILETLHNQIGKLANQASVRKALKARITGDSGILDQVGTLVQRRLDELTPQMVKEIVQRMIDEHLGWLVVWGGVFGGLIGLISGLLLNSDLSF